MHAQNTLLLDNFNGYKAHLWVASCFTDGWGDE